MIGKRMTCILCPNGCELDVACDGKPTIQTVRVEGNLCPRGAEYALEELTHPKRTLTTSILVRRGTQPQTSVKTTEPVPRELLGRVRETLRSIVIDAPVASGTVIATNVAGTGVNVVVTRSVDRRARGLR